VLSSVFQEIGFNFGEFIYSNFWRILGFEFIIILVLNMVSTSFAMRKYLKI